MVGEQASKLVDSVVAKGALVVGSDGRTGRDAMYAGMPFVVVVAVGDGAAPVVVAVPAELELELEAWDDNDTISAPTSAGVQSM